MSDFTQNFLAGIQAGQAHVKAQQEHEKELEDLDLRKKLFKHNVQQATLEAELKKKEFEIKSARAQQEFFTGASPVGGDGAPAEQNPVVQFPGAGAVRPPTSVDLKKAFEEQEAIKSKNRIAENLARPTSVASTAMVQVVDPDIAKQLGVQVGESVPKGSIDQISDMLTRKRLEGGGRPEQYKPVVFIDPQGRAVSRDAVTGAILWTSGEGELRPTDGRLTGAFRESLVGKTDAIQGLGVVETHLNNPTVQQYMGPLGGRLTLAAAALGGVGVPPEVQRAATEMKRLLATQAFAFGGKTLTPTELQTYTSVLPQLTDTFSQAVQKWEQARDYLRRSLTNSLATSTAAERASLGQTPAGRRILDVAGWNDENGPTPSKFGTPPPAARQRAQSPDGKIMEYNGKSWVLVK